MLAVFRAELRARIEAHADKVAVYEAERALVRAVARTYRPAERHIFGDTAKNPGSTVYTDRD